ncbi:MAG: protein N-lysine methyltransferase family protein [Desulfovibrionaceae bacterium]|nr:protein N-lysine methyltransferase family protein [Desulfovibrionaceae bacterium]
MTMPDASSSMPLWPDASLDDLLALAGSRYALEFTPVSAGGVTLHILQIADMRERLDRAIAQNALQDALNTLPLWAKIWPAALILGHVLRHMPIDGRSFLEIGAGCGVTGLVAAALGFERVCISDVNEDALLFARINILKNGLQERAQVRRVDVSSDTLDERFSVIAGSEILYLEHLYRPLVKFFKRHLAAQDNPEVLLATDHRRKAKPFFKRAGKEFRIEHRQIGARETPTSGMAADAPTDTVDAAHTERHLLTVHRLTPLR